jgi:hypothetical protein
MYLSRRAAAMWIDRAWANDRAHYLTASYGGYTCRKPMVYMIATGAGYIVELNAHQFQ